MKKINLFMEYINANINEFINSICYNLVRI